MHVLHIESSSLLSPFKRFFLNSTTGSRSNPAGDGPASTQKGGFIVEQLEGPIRFLDIRVKFKRQLSGFPRFFHLSARFRESNFILQGDQPRFRQGGDLISYRSGTAVELSRCGSEKTASSKNNFLHVSQPTL